MFIQTEITPNPNSLKFLPGKKVSNIGTIEITKKDESNNQLVKDILAVNGVEGILLASDFISVNKSEEISWDEIKHIIISLINDFYSSGKEFVIDKSPFESEQNLGEIEKKIVKILDKGIILELDHSIEGIVLYGKRPKRDRKALSANYKIGDVLNGTVFNVRPDDKKIVLHVEGLAPDDGSKKDDIREFLENQDAPASEKIQIPDDLV